MEASQVHAVDLQAASSILVLVSLTWTTRDWTRDDLVKNPIRARLLRIVAASPGIQQAELMRRLDIHPGAYYHHLHLLKRARLLSVRAHGRARLVFPSGAAQDAPAAAEAASLPLRKTARMVAEEICARPGRSPAKMSEELGLSGRVVQYHVQRLVRAGLVTTASPRRYTDLAAKPALVEMLRPRPGAEPG